MQKSGEQSKNILSVDGSLYLNVLQLKLQLSRTFLCILLIRNRMISRKIWTTKLIALILWTLAVLMLFENLTHACFIQIALETMLLPILTNYEDLSIVRVIEVFIFSYRSEIICEVNYMLGLEKVIFLGAQPGDKIFLQTNGVL